ncbi:hypothetical protein RAO21_02585 [Pediococcus acidilactici]
MINSIFNVLICLLLLGEYSVGYSSGLDEDDAVWLNVHVIN